MICKKDVWCVARAFLIAWIAIFLLVLAVTHCCGPAEAAPAPRVVPIPPPSQPLSDQMAGSDYRPVGRHQDWTVFEKPQPGPVPFFMGTETPHGALGVLCIDVSAQMSGGIWILVTEESLGNSGYMHWKVDEHNPHRVDIINSRRNPLTGNLVTLLQSQDVARIGKKLVRGRTLTILFDIRGHEFSMEYSLMGFTKAAEDFADRCRAVLEGEPEVEKLPEYRM